MRKMSLCLLAVVTLAVPASAQTGASAAEKLSAKGHCAKADPSYTIEVGDKAGHVLTMSKGMCTWPDEKISGIAVKSGEDEGTGDVSGSTARQNGYHTVTLENGDKYTVRYSGTTALTKDNTGTGEGKWTMISGTGKLKGIKGSGTYKSTFNADGTLDITADGEYTLAPAKPATPVKKK